MYVTMGLKEPIVDADSSNPPVVRIDGALLPIMYEDRIPGPAENYSRPIYLNGRCSDKYIVNDILPFHPDALRANLCFRRPLAMNCLLLHERLHVDHHFGVRCISLFYPWVLDSADATHKSLVTNSEHQYILSAVAVATDPQLNLRIREQILANNHR